MAGYIPRPIDTRDVELGSDLLDLTEKLAENAHDNWAQMRFEDGWSLGSKRDDDPKRHPNLVPYSELSEADKDLDRGTAMESLKAVLALGYEITKR